MKWPIRVRASARSMKMAASTHSRHRVPQKRSILPNVCGRCGDATICLIPCFSHSLLNALFPRHVTYCAPLSVSTSPGTP